VEGHRKLVQHYHHRTVTYSYAQHKSGGQKHHSQNKHHNQAQHSARKHSTHSAKTHHASSGGSSGPDGSIGALVTLAAGVVADVAAAIFGDVNLTP